MCQRVLLSEFWLDSQCRPLLGPFTVTSLFVGSSQVEGDEILYDLEVNRDLYVCTEQETGQIQNF